MKRTRPIHGKYFQETPRVVIGGRIISLRLRISQVTIIDHGPAKGLKREGEIERGRVDGDED